MVYEDCRYCGARHRHLPLKPGERACCARCGLGLYQDKQHLHAYVLPLVLTALLLLVLAHVYPIAVLDLRGTLSQTTLWGTVVQLWQYGLPSVATVIWLTTFILPALELLLLLVLALNRSPSLSFPARWQRRCQQLILLIRPWTMTEVLLVGILITIAKLSTTAEVHVGVAFWAFAALVVVQSCIALLPLERARPEPQASSATPPTGTASQSTPPPPPAPDTLARSWAYLIAAYILYIPANVLPIMHTQSLLSDQSDTIFSGIVFLWLKGSVFLALVVLVASIIVPLMKMIILTLLLISAHRQKPWRLRQQTRLYAVLEFVGRWSMLDIFVVALLAALVQAGSLATITPGTATLPFAAVVVLTMLAAHSFDPRLLWAKAAPSTPTLSHDRLHVPS